MIQNVGFPDPNCFCMNYCSVNDPNNFSPSLPALRVLINDVTITMKVKIDENIQFGDILFPEWVFSALNMEPAIECTYNTIHHSDLLVQKNVKVELCFISYRRLRQWDEGVSNLSLFEQPLFWCDQWPDSVDVSILETMCPLLLCGDYIGYGSVIAIKVMDLTMLFLASFPTDGEINQAACSDSVLKASLATRYAVRHSNSVETIEPESRSAVGANAACPSTTASKILLHSQLLFAGDTNVLSSGHSLIGNSSRALVRSILLCGAEGAGKSHLLLWLMAKLSTVFHTSPTPNALYASARNINKLIAGKALHSVAELLQKNDLHDGSTTNRRSACAYLAVLLEVLEVESMLRLAAVGALLRGECLLVVLDDLDVVLRQYGVSGGDDNAGEESAFEGAATVEPGNEFQIVGYLMNKLLQFLAPSCTGGESGCAAMVVGACRLDHKVVPRTHTGCPEFELRVLLPRMSVSDRSIVVLDMMSSHLSQHPVQLEALSGVEGGDQATILKCWASSIATITAGYLPGDLLALVRHTFLIHRGLSEASGVGEDKKLCWTTLLQALLSLPPKQLQSLGIDSSSGGGGPSQQSRLSWSDFAGYQHETRQIKRLFANPRLVEMEAEVAASSSGLTLAGLFSCPRGIVLHGPTGCGKSMLARVIAAEANMNFVSIRSTEILSQYFGQTEASVRSLFAKARAASPCVLFFDEFDAIAHKRGGGDDTSSGLHGRILSTFLNELDGVAGGGTGGFESSVLVLAACSDLSTLDEALLRPGRLQHHVFLGKPSLEDVDAIVRRQMQRMPCVEGEDIIDVPLLCSRLMYSEPSCADAEALCQKALTAAIREEILRSQEYSEHDSMDDAARRVVHQRHFDAALQELTGWNTVHVEEGAVETEGKPLLNKPFEMELSGTFHF